jgi:hypothetical protein
METAKTKEDYERTLRWLSFNDSYPAGSKRS